MARNQSALVNWSQYLALRALAGTVQCFDVDQNIATADAVGAVYYRANRRRRERAERNLRLSFPDWSPERVAATAEASFRNMFRLFLVDSIMMPRLISPSSWPDHIEIGTIADALDLMIRRRPAIFVTGHCGNWELLGFALAVMGFPMAALARPIDNPLINDWLLGIREARGLRVITKWGAAPILREILDDGGRIGFIADQNAGDGGLFVPFFGRLASNYKSIALLAMRHRVPVVAGHTVRLGPHLRFRIDCTDIMQPEEWEAQDDPLFYITARVSRAMESMVRAAPEQYLWHHRRWKSRPRFEREGREMPGRLRRKLEALPWMTPTELDRIVALANDPAHWEAA